MIYTKYILPLLVSTLFFAGNTFAQSNQYLHFDGQDDYTEFPQASQYLEGLNTISMAGWFYTDELIYGQGMMSIRGGGSGDGQMYLIQLNNGTLECRVLTSTGLHEFVGPEGTVEAGTWQHFAWVFDQNTVELFVDGQSIGTGNASGTFDSDDRPFTIGKTLQSGFNFVFKGRADEVSLWSKALTQAEIQDMIDNELNGDEEDLVTYYKFNQGTPAGNNQNIEELISEVDIDRNANLLNFSLMGETSNFNGELESGFQSISFEPIPNKLISDDPFDVQASATSGLPVSFEVTSGPASVDGNTVTLTGEPGTVTIVASQEGNDTFDPADDVTATFEVLDPATTLPEIDILHPLAGDVRVPELMPVKVAVKSTIGYPDLFSVDGVSVNIDGEEIDLEAQQNGHFTGWWTPESYGSFELEVSSSNNYGNSGSASASINIIEEIEGTIATATDEVWVNADVPTQTVTAELPSYVGAYDQIMGTLDITCPPGGCDPWDRISSIEVQGKDGVWYEIIRYLTPYGVPCDHEIDLTDFMSLLSGKTAFRVNLGTQGNGFEYTLELDYQAGVPDNPYGHVQKLWNQTYQFGDPANLQPTEDINASFPQNTQEAKIKIVSTGHGWGENNTSNAAEFNENTHHIWVDGNETFEQNNWNDCDPNPDNCSPQNGTWYFDRAGWCPGTIAPYFNFDMNPFTGQDDVLLEYVFDEGYVDNCHPNNPDCVSGVTCPNCDDGFNPHLIVASYLISFGNSPLQTVGLADDPNVFEAFNLFPNPSAGKFAIGFDERVSSVRITVFDNTGRSIKNVQPNRAGELVQLDLGNVSAGIYFVKVETDKGLGVKKLVVE